MTPALDGIILPGVVRQSLLDLARTWVRAVVGGMRSCRSGVGGAEAKWHGTAPLWGGGTLSFSLSFRREGATGLRCI